MKGDRFLTVILVFIALLIVASLVVFFVRQDSAIYLPENSPENIVHNYILAIEKAEYARAYGYLAEKGFDTNSGNKPAYEEFEDNFLFAENNIGYQIGKAAISGRTARVELTIMEGSGDFMFDRYDYVDRAHLVKEEGGWKISQMPYAYWNWGWYEKE